MSKNPEYERFDNLMQKIVEVPHDKIKTKLEAEKRKKAKKHPIKRPSVSRDSGDDGRGSGGN